MKHGLERVLLALVIAWTTWSGIGAARLTWRYLDARDGSSPQDGSWLLHDFPFLLAWRGAFWLVVAFVLAGVWWGLRVQRPFAAQRASSQ